MFWYVVLAILILAGVTLVESFLIVFVAGLLGIGVSFKVIFFVMFVINFFTALLALPVVLALIAFLRLGFLTPIFI